MRTAIERMHGTGYSRLPVYHEDCDRIVGIVHYKDLIAPLMDGHAEEPVGKYAYEAMFVPETKDIFPLLSEMQTNRQQMAIVVDEYGGTDGLITIEDIVEEIVGEIIDESDAESKYLTLVGEEAWRVDVYKRQTPRPWPTIWTTATMRSPTSRRRRPASRRPRYWTRF